MHKLSHILFISDVHTTVLVTFMEQMGIIFAPSLESVSKIFSEDYFILFFYETRSIVLVWSYETNIK